MNNDPLNLIDPSGLLAREVATKSYGLMNNLTSGLSNAVSALDYHIRNKNFEISVTIDAPVGAIDRALGGLKNLPTNAVAGVSVGLAFQLPTHPQGADFGIVAERRAGGGEGFATGGHVNVGINHGGVKDLAGGGSDFTVQAGFAGAAWNFNNGSAVPQGASLSGGFGIALEAMKTATDVYSSRHGAISSGCGSNINCSGGR